jgi:cellobiose phosphorylase
MTIFNHSGDHKLIDITSYAEVVLAPPANDDAHPAFSKLFIQTEIIDHPKAILCHRRSGGSDSNEPWMFHMVVAGVAASSDISCETDRARFLGRGGTPASPLAIRRREPKLSGSQGSVLDPIVAIRCPLRLRPGQSAEITYILGAG